MVDGEPHESRRRFLQLTGCGSLVVTSGCLGGGEESEGDGDDERPDDWCFDDLSESPPEAERTAVSIDGIERKDPDDLRSKQEAGYQCGPLEGQQCGNCTFYIDDKSGDAIGACTEVEGGIRSVDWCGLWAPREKVGVSDDD